MALTTRAASRRDRAAGSDAASSPEVTAIKQGQGHARAAAQGRARGRSLARDPGRVRRLKATAADRGQGHGVVQRAGRQLAAGQGHTVVRERRRRTDRRLRAVQGQRVRRGQLILDAQGQRVRPGQRRGQRTLVVARQGRRNTDRTTMTEHAHTHNVTIIHCVVLCSQTLCVFSSVYKCQFIVAVAMVTNRRMKSCICFAVHTTRSFYNSVSSSAYCRW